jgi:Protein of unknown function (DUF2721)
MDPSSNVFQVLSAMITPSVLISAAGLLVLSTSNRLSRVVDRVRTLADRVSEIERNHESTQFFLEQISRLSKRALLLRSALTSLYIAITLFVTTSILLGIFSILSWSYGWIPAVTALVGSCTLLYGSVLLISEARHAIASTLQELQGIRESIDHK